MYITAEFTERVDIVFEIKQLEKELREDSIFETFYCAGGDPKVFFLTNVTHELIESLKLISYVGGTAAELFLNIPMNGPILKVNIASLNF
jgi:hypothetical protein